jgi:TolB-like protein/DNA-binding winged helix-turn-helix (wHTH) protein/Tfp pilus assembly protein PilF
MGGGQNPERLRFGAFEVDVRAGDLRKHGLRIKLQEKPFQVLAMLVERPGEVVTREELRQRLWPDGTFVDFEHGLNTAVNKLREALNDSAESPRFIETLPRRGYRFLYPVNGVGEQAAPAPPRRRRRVMVWTAVAVALLAVVALLAGQWWRSTPPPAPIRLAVLPFENLSGDPGQEYLTDGLTEGMIAQLGRLAPEQLRVIARTSVTNYRETGKRPRQIGRELGVDYLLESSVRRSGERVRIASSLVHATSEEQRWSEVYEFALDESVAAQERIAIALARALTVKLLPDEQTAIHRHRLTVPGAHEAYLKGRHHLAKRREEEFGKAVAHFERAIALDPGYAAAYAGLADAYNLLATPEYGGIPPREALPRGRAAALKALELDPLLADAYVALAGVVLARPGEDYLEAERRLRKAIELNPSLAQAHHWLGWSLASRGRHDEAIAQLEYARELDPLSSIINADLGWALFLTRRYDRAIEQLHATRELDPSFVRTHYLLGRVFAQTGKHEDAIAAFHRAAELSGNNPVFVAGLGLGYARAGRRQEALRILDDLLERSRRSYVPAYHIALLYVRLEDKEQALAWLERGYAEESDFQGELQEGPELDSLRDDPRFQDLLRRMRFPK